MPQAGEDLAVDRVVALAAAGRDDQVHAALEVRIVLDARRVEGKARRVAAELLPGLHLAQVGFLGDLALVIQRHHGMDRIGREGVEIGGGARRW